jgi:uncharacterized membrane protein YdcZ (DUF606 family)
MRKAILILAYIMTALALIFSIVPMDTIAFLPIGIALLCSLVVLKKSTDANRKVPKVLLTIGVLCSIYVLGKMLLIKDEVAKDVQFEQHKVQENKAAKKELEEIEGLE